MIVWLFYVVFLGVGYLNVTPKTLETSLLKDTLVIPAEAYGRIDQRSGVNVTCVFGMQSQVTFWPTMSIGVLAVAILMSHYLFKMKKIHLTRVRQREENLGSLDAEDEQRREDIENFLSKQPAAFKHALIELKKKNSRKNNIKYRNCKMANIFME